MPSNIITLSAKMGLDGVQFIALSFVVATTASKDGIDEDTLIAEALENAALRERLAKAVNETDVARFVPRIAS